MPPRNKLASLEATLVRNSADSLTHLLTGVKCRATSVAKNIPPLNQVPRALGSSWPKGREDPSCQKGSSGPIDKSTDKIKICLCCKALYSSWVISEERLTKLDRGLRIQWERGRGRGRNITTSLKASKSFSFLFRFSSLNVSL